MRLFVGVGRGTRGEIEVFRFHSLTDDQMNALIWSTQPLVHVFQSRSEQTLLIHLEKQRRRDETTTLITRAESNVQSVEGAKIH